MIKNIILGVTAVTLISACGGSESSSDNSEVVSVSPVNVSSGVSKDAECIKGRFRFRIDSEGANSRGHFSAFFDGNGFVQYYTKGGPTGTYTVNGRAIAFIGPFGPNRSDYELNWTLNDCPASNIKGVSRGGSVMTATIE